MLPLELYELIWHNPELLQRYTREASLLLGEEIRDFNDFKIIGVKVSKLSRSKGIKYPDKHYKDFVHYYKDVSAELYIKYPILSAMRGSVTREYDNGEVKQVAFPFAKFFNRGEVRATSKLPRTRFIATEKLDGTLIIAWIDPDTSEIRFNTRGMLDQHSIIKGRANYYVQATPGKLSNPFIIRFINSVKRHKLWNELEDIVKENHTVMFELVYKIPASHQFDVFETPEDSDDWKPYLLAYRDHKTLKLEYIDNTGFPTPTRYNVNNLREALELVMTTDNKEGIVLYYPEELYHPELPWWNYLVKLKNRIYVLKSYIQSGEAMWKHLALLVINGKEDDVIPILDQEKVDFVKEYRKKYDELAMIWEDFINTALELKEKHGNKVYNVLMYNLRMKPVVKYLRVAEKIIAKRDRETALKISLEGVVKEFLIYKNSRTSMLKALDRFKSRLEKVREELKKQLG